MPLLVETVVAESMDGLRAARDAVRHADLVELRLDGVADLDVAGALAGRRTPVVVTCRPAWEGGRFAGSEEERRRILEQGMRLGAEYVDVEWRAGFDSLIRHRGGGGVIVSAHDFAGVPANLPAQVRAMRASGAEVVKVAITAARLSDCLPLTQVTGDGPTVAIAMGPAGMPTRILAARFGSCWSYAGNGVAPGQIPAERLVDEFRFRQVTAATAIYGVVGAAAGASRSPGLHNAWFRDAGIDAVYVPLQAADFDDFLAFADAMRVAGASVTIPFKLDALRRAATAEDAARRVGAANTLRRTAGGWEAANTDVAGFLAPLQDRDLHGTRATVLGAGGAARAVVVALVSAGAQPTICARRIEQAREVAALGAGVGEWPPRPGSWDLLVNCTPLGGISAPEASPLPGGPFDGRLVYDVIYQPDETRLLREARAAGCATINGLPMLRAQAERQFDWWTKSLCT